MNWLLKAFDASRVKFLIRLGLAKRTVPLGRAEHHFHVDGFALPNDAHVGGRPALRGAQREGRAVVSDHPQRYQRRRVSEQDMDDFIFATRARSLSLSLSLCSLCSLLRKVCARPGLSASVGHP